LRQRYRFCRVCGPRWRWQTYAIAARASLVPVSPLYSPSAEKLSPGSSVPSGDKAPYSGEKMRTIIAVPLVSAVCLWAGITQAPAQSQGNPLHAAGAGLSLTENSQTHTTESGNEHSGEPRAQSGSSLSRELNQSGGVIHPPPSADRNVVTPPNRATSSTPVIPPPGTPGGNPLVQPK
jgi:hypothetical protein